MINLYMALEKAKKWAQEAGKIQVENLGKVDLQVETKSSQVDMVTEIDKRSEDILLGAIRKTYPEHGIMSEEFGVDREDAEYVWVIDPLDGTTNYAQGLPIFAISMALQYRRETVLGLIYQPMLFEMFTAIKNEKAWLNGKQITVSANTDFKDCVLASGFPYDRAEHPENNAAYFAHFVPKVKGLRRMGAAAYDLACVAAGRLDGYWELNLSPWDVAAGELIVKEAGGSIIRMPEKRGISLVAGNCKISEKIFSELKNF